MHPPLLVPDTVRASALLATFLKTQQHMAIVVDESGAVRRFVNVYVSGEDIRFQDGLENAVTAGDEVTILPAVAGGG